MTGTPRLLIDDLAAELGAVVARIERDLTNKFNAMAADLRAENATLRAKAAELELKAVTGEHARMEMLTARLLALRDGDDGRSVTVEDVAPMISAQVQAEVAKAVAAVLAVPDPAGAEDVRVMIAEAVAALPAPAAGKDADPAVIAKMVEDAVAKLPAPKDGGPGPMGKMPIAKAWSDSVHYEGAVVTHDGATWQASRDTGRAPPHDDWVCLAAAGAKGDAGQGLMMRGTWEPTGSYKAMDFVAWNGGSWVAKHDDPGECPGEGWQLLASAGRRGKAADKAPAIPGPPGPKVVAAEIDGRGMLTLTNADGSVVRCDFYPLLIRVQG